MKPSDISHKCGSKRKNHKCGLGLCSEVVVIESDIAPKKQKLETADTNTFKRMKSCGNCGRAVQGHPLPRGSKCNLIPLPQINDINSEKRKNQLAKKRERSRSEEAKAKDNEKKSLRFLKLKQEKEIGQKKQRLKPEKETKLIRQWLSQKREVWQQGN